MKRNRPLRCGQTTVELGSYRLGGFRDTGSCDKWGVVEARESASSGR
jgi:hypothetical protein